VRLLVLSLKRVQQAVRLAHLLLSLLPESVEVVPDVRHSVQGTVDRGESSITRLELTDCQEVWENSLELFAARDQGVAGGLDCCSAVGDGLDKKLVNAQDTPR